MVHDGRRALKKKKTRAGKAVRTRGLVRIQDVNKHCLHANAGVELQFTSTGALKHTKTRATETLLFKKKKTQDHQNGRADGEPTKKLPSQIMEKCKARKQLSPGRVEYIVELKAGKAPRG